MVGIPVIGVLVQLLLVPVKGGEVVIAGPPGGAMTVEPAAATVTASFMPLPQWPAIPQMK